MVIITIMVAAIVIKKAFDEFLSLFHLETPAAKKENERKEEIREIREQLKCLQEHQLKIQENDQNMSSHLERLENTLNSHIVANMRSTLWHIYKESKDAGYVTKESLTTFLECGRVYETAGGNDIYHEKLYPEMMNLEVKED